MNLVYNSYDVNVSAVNKQITNHNYPYDMMMIEWLDIIIIVIIIIINVFLFKLYFFTFFKLEKI